MKKNRKWTTLLSKLNMPRKLLLIMRISFIFLFAALLQVSAAGLAQKVVISENNVTYKQLFKEIRKQTGIATVLSNDEIDLNSNVSIESSEFELENLLIEITKETGLTYELVDNYIVIRPLTPKEKAIKTVTQQPEEKKVLIKGTVLDDTGEPLPFVAVCFKGTTTGCISSTDGTFALEVPDEEGLVLEVSSLGFVTQEIPVDGRSIINIILAKDNLGLDEVVVVGYGTQKRERIGSAISEIKAEEIEQKSIGVTSFENMLGGNIKGLQVSQGSSAPGAAAVIRVRGITSPFSGGNNQPLYVIDGVEFNTDAVMAGGGEAAQNPLESISPSDIKSISVLKDAGATAIYGSRGANGVIIVTTKRGRRNSELNVSLDASLSVSNPINKWDLLNSDEFKRLHQMVAVNTTEKFGTSNDLANLIYNADTETFNDTYYDLVKGEEVDMWGTSKTDWQNEMYKKNAPTQKYNLSLSGGTEKTNFSGSLYYNSTDGLMINEYQKRYGSRLSVDTDVNTWMRIGTSLNVSGAKNFAGRNSSTGFGPVSEALRARPDWAVNDEYGTYIRQISPDVFTATPNGATYRSLAPNPVASTLNRNTIKSLSVFGNAYVEIQPIKDLKLRSDLNVANFISKGENFRPIVANLYLLTTNNYNSKSLSHSNFLSTTLNFQANYLKVIGDHSFDLMAGLSSNKNRAESERHSFTNTADDTYMTNIDTGTHTTSSEGKGESIMNSWYSRLQYSYKGKYTLTANMRSDKSSKFGPGNKRGYFPSGAISWNIAQENFMKGLSKLNVLKLRASYGKTGLANISDFTYLRFWSTPWNATSYKGENVLLPEDTYPNEDIQWETTKELNVGVDFALFDNRLWGSIDYYDKYTNGAIMPTPIYAETGASLMYANRAEISNKGMEFGLGGDIIRTSNLKWSASFNVAYNRNLLESIQGNAIDQWVVSSYVEGEPVGVINGQRVSHIIQDQAEIDALNAKAPNGYYQDATTGVGDYLYVDTNEDGQVDAEDRTVIGSQEPDFFGGFSTSLSYKQFAITAGFQYSVGNEKEWINAGYMYLSAGAFANMGKDALYNTWTEDNKNAKYPRLAYGNGNNHNFRGTHDRVIQDASYLRLKVINVSYTLPKRITDQLHIGGMIVYVGGTNLLTFTKYEGLDPESMGNMSSGPGDTGSVLSGVQGSDAYPMARTFTMGVKLTF